MVVSLLLLGAPAALTEEAPSTRGLGEAITTAAQLPDAILAQLPATAAEAGYDYAPRLVKVTVETPEERNTLANSGLDVTEHGGHNYLEVVLSDPTHEQVISDLGLDFKVVTPDLIAQETQRILADAAYFQDTEQSPLPTGRTTYRVLQDFYDEVDQLAADNPDLAKRISVGESVEGRDLAGIEIGVGVNEPEDGRPVFLMFGNHHAREWPSAEAPMDFAQQLVMDFNAGDQRTVDLLNRIRVIIVPVSNPDGYLVSRTAGDIIDLNTVDGGGTVSILATPGNAYKRKNCRIVNGQAQPGGTCDAFSSPGGYGIGIDLNRNYGALWGGPGTDGDPNSASPVYRGPAPFSEPETQAIRTLISERQVTTLISNHTFSNLLLRPVGVNPQTVHPDGLPVGFAPDECFTTPGGADNGMQALGERMTAQTGYSNQFGWELYDTTGTTEDYSYNATGGYGYTFEIGPEQFHPPYEEYIAEYTGEAAAAQAVTSESASSLTTSAGRTCPGEHQEHGVVGGGLREAYYIAMENAADTATHSVIEGVAPEGAEIAVTRSGTFPLWDGTPVEDTVATSMVVSETGEFTYHVNPSTRPFVDSRPYIDGEIPAAPVTVVSEEQRTGNTQPPNAGETSLGTGYEDVGIDVPEGIDALLIHITSEPGNDYDAELYGPDGVLLASSGAGDTDERLEHVSSAGIVPGQYVVRVINYLAATDWVMDITQGTVPEVDPREELLEFSPRTEELWTVTCTVDEAEVGSQDVAVDRGQSVDVGDLCDAGIVAGGGVTRLSGPSRFATAIDVSQDRFPEADSAGAVVLARGDDPNGFADALAGGPLAVDRNAPLLITSPEALDAGVKTEIDRVLPDGGTVYLLGGEAALSPAVQTVLVDDGYDVQRVFGPDRYSTAVAIADELGNPDLVLIATGEAFADALTSSAAAGANEGAVLLTNGDQAHPLTSAYLETNSPSQVIAVGGPAVAAFPDATPAVGSSRFETGTVLAGMLFDELTVAGLARGDAYPDALSGGAHIAALGGPVLLTESTSLNDTVAGLLCGAESTLEHVYLYGGEAALSGGVFSGAEQVVSSEACPA